MRVRQPHELRVIAELVALNDKLVKLVEFLGGNQGAILICDVVEIHRLRKQRDVMTEYADILVDRINAFPSLEAS